MVGFHKEENMKQQLSITLIKSHYQVTCFGYRVSNCCSARDIFIMAEGKTTRAFQDKTKPTQVRLSNIIAAKCKFTIGGSLLYTSLTFLAVADCIRTSLGPKGMDKMVFVFEALVLMIKIQSGDGDVTITNDGATILSLINVIHPAAKMVCYVTMQFLCSHRQLVELSKAQDIEAGDGTTSVVVLAGSLLGACERLLEKGISKNLSLYFVLNNIPGIHASAIAESFQKASAKAAEILEKVGCCCSFIADGVGRCSG
jgi:T-complex protein 1 subunit delta